MARRGCLQPHTTSDDTSGRERDVAALTRDDVGANEGTLCKARRAVVTRRRNKTEMYVKTKSTEGAAKTLGVEKGIVTSDVNSLNDPWFWLFVATGVNESVSSRKRKKGAAQS